MVLTEDEEAAIKAAVLGGARVPSSAASGRSKLRLTLLRDVSLFRHLCASAPQTAFLRLRVAATEHALVGRLGCAVDAQLPGLLHCLRRFVKALPTPSGLSSVQSPTSSSA